MRWQEQSTDNCSVQRTVEITGRPWAMLVLRELFRGLHRFEQIVDHLGISPAVLSRRLREFEAHELVHRCEYHERGQRRRDEYHLTAAGDALFPVLVALHEWGDAHMSDTDGPATVYRHRDCGGEVYLSLSCERGHRLRDRTEIDVQPGPGARPLIG